MKRDGADVSKAPRRRVDTARRSVTEIVADDLHVDRHLLPNRRESDEVRKHLFLPECDDLLRHDQ